MAGIVPKQNWTLADAPRLDGKVAIVTGATGGLGYETALGLARQGATTILAGRNAAKGAEALDRIQRAVPAARVRFETLDLASLGSIVQFAGNWARGGTAQADGLQSGAGTVDILVNNAGVMGLPTRQVTRDGFEQQVGVNYLGHFALTAGLKDALCAAAGGGRVVNVASLAHRRVTLDLDDLQSGKSYVPRGAYALSKLAMLMFSLELQRRAERFGWKLRSIAVHPGWAKTDIISNGMGAGGFNLKPWLIDKVFGLVAQSARDGALPSLYAATAAEAQGGAYYGPSGRGETRGAPGLARIFPQAADLAGASGLWVLSEKLTGVAFG